MLRDPDSEYSRLAWAYRPDPGLEVMFFYQAIYSPRVVGCRITLLYCTSSSSRSPGLPWWHRHISSTRTRKQRIDPRPSHVNDFHRALQSGWGYMGIVDPAWLVCTLMPPFRLVTPILLKLYASSYLLLHYTEKYRPECSLSPQTLFSLTR